MSRSFRRLNFPPVAPESFRGGRFKADEDATAPGLGRQHQELLVIGKVDGGLGDPFLAQIRPGHGSEQVFGAGDVVGPSADKVVVHDQDKSLADQLKLLHNVRDGPLPVVGPVERRDTAEATIQWTTARGLDGSKGITPGQEIVTGGNDIGHLGEASVVSAFQAALPGVLQDLRPNAIGLPGDDRIHVLQDFVEAHGGVNAAHDDRHTHPPEVIGQLIGTVGLRGERGDADQVGPGQGRIIGHTEVLVHDGDLPLRRCQTSQDHQAQRLPHAVTVPAALLDFDDADKRIARVN